MKAIPQQLQYTTVRDGQVGEWVTLPPVYQSLKTAAREIKARRGVTSGCLWRSVSAGRAAALRGSGGAL